MNERTYTADEFYAMHAEYEAEYTAQLETIARLKEALRHIHLTAAKATPDTYAHAIGWIEVKSNHILEETAEPLTPDESTAQRNAASVVDSGVFD